MQMRDKLIMQAQNKPVKPLDDRTKTKKEIAAMISRMMNTDKNGEPENKGQP